MSDRTSTQPDTATDHVTAGAGSAETPVEVTDMMQPGHISLPNGLGLRHPAHGTVGVAPRELTSLELRDGFAGTPWHKHVPARIERIQPTAEVSV